MSKNSSKSISYALGGAAHTGSHILPINAIRKHKDKQFTAGRDGALVLYDADANIQNHIQLHSDWANDVVWHSGSTLISCSSDLSVQWWDYERNEHGLLGYHEDYVKTLTTTRNGRIVTGGLDKVVNIWDVEKRTKLSSLANDYGEMGSVYSMASANDIVAFGDNRARISLIDMRTPNQVTSVLEGHTDTVKGLVMYSHGCLSGSSDGCVKLWDVRQNRMVKEYNHKGSVWSLHCDDPTFNTFYTGTLQGTLYKTSQDISEVVGQQEKGILSICQFRDELWTSTMGDSSLKNWTYEEKSKRGDAGLIKSRMLNNRRYVVTLGTDNEVCLWDIVKCCQLKNFGTKRAYEEVINEYQTKEILPTWCQVMIRAGRLFVVLKESSYTNTELYGDDLSEYDLSELSADNRYSIGKIMIASIFKELVGYELAKDRDLREARVKEIKSSSKLSLLTKFSSHDAVQSSQPTPVEDKNGYFSESEAPPQSAPANLDAEKDPSSGFRRLKLFSRKSKSSANTTNSGACLTEDERENDTQSVSMGNASQPQTPITSQPGSHDASRKASEIDADTFATVLTEVKTFYDATTSASLLNQSQLQPPGKDEVPILDLPNNLRITVISCISSTSGDVAIYSDEVKDLNFHALESVLPRWVGMLVLKNKCIVKDYPKVGFTIQCDENEKNLPALRNNNGRLNAYSMLRVKRILTYITDRFDSPTFEMANGVDAENWLEVLCHGEVLDHNMTLATVRSVLWKQSGDVVISFRRKVSGNTRRSTIL